MTYDSKIVAAMYDFDIYALYYRADLFQQKGMQVPTTWDELLAVAKQLQKATNTCMNSTRIPSTARN